MKIAIYHFLPSGGAKRALYELIKVLKKFNHQIDLYIPSDECEEFCDLRPIVENTYDYKYVFPKFPFSLISFFLNLLFFERVQKKIAREIDQKKYDFVFINHCKITQSPSILRFLHTPSIYYCQEPFRLSYEYQFYSKEINKVPFWKKPIFKLNIFFRGYLDRINAKKAALILVNSYYSLESVFKAYGIYPKVCYLGVDVDKFKPLNIKKENLIISIGTMKSHKSFDFLVEAMQYIPHEIRPKLEIIYNRKDPTHEQSLINKAKSLRVNINFINNISDDELVKEYNKAKITINTASVEPFGLTTLESMSCETPVIGLKEAGTREIIDNDVNGILVDRDQRKLAKEIISLLTDKERYLSLKSNCRKTIMKKWKWEYSAQNLNDFFTNFKK